MIIRRVLSLALAMSMIAVIFTGMSVSAETLTGTVQTYTWDGATATSQSTFWTADGIYFNLEFKVDGNLRMSPFIVVLYNSNWGLLDTRSVSTPNADVYKSWDTNTHFHTGAAGTYYLAAYLVNSTQLLCTDSFTVRSAGVDYDQETYNPGQTANFNITTTYSGRINVTVGIANITWTNQTLTDNSWSGSWAIPSNIKTGAYPLYINRSTDNVPIGFPGGTVLEINIQVLDFISTMDKDEYLPGETATISWVATAIPSNALLNNVSLDWNMTYRDSIDGKWKWQNVTKTDGSFTVVLPANANVNNEISVDATAYIVRNQSRTHSGMIIDIAGLMATTSVTPNPVTVGQSVVVTVTAQTISNNVAIEGANVSVTIYDSDGITTNLTLTGLMTDANGKINGMIKIPTTLKAGTYSVTSTVKKLGYTWMSSVVLTVNDDKRVEVKLDKNIYVGGGVIKVEVKTILNGEIVSPDFIEYKLWLGDAGKYTVVQVTTSSNFTIDVPANTVETQAQVRADVNVDDEVITGWSDQFEIQPLVIILGASEMIYSAGDTVNFEAQVLGSASGYSITYTITDADGVAVATDVALTIGTNNKTSFKLVVPKDTPSDSYTATVTADNKAGRIVSEDITVELIGDYLLNIKVTTGPAYSTGEFAPGQMLKVTFDITKQNKDKADFLVVTAAVVLYRGEDMSSPPIFVGEVKNFETMSGELNLTLPEELSTGAYVVSVMASCDDGFEDLQDYEQISVADNGNGWNSNLGGLSVGDMLMTIMMIVVIIMLLWQMIKGRAAAAGAGAASKPAEPKAKEESYAPKSTVTCASCSSPIEVATSKRPIEVMCPKCGKSQMVN